MPEVAIILVCVECNAESEEGARGWRAYLTGTEGEVDGVEIYCPACADREFSGA